MRQAELWLNTSNGNSLQPPEIMTTMKNLLLILLSAFLAASSSQAALITYTDTNNVTTGGSTFTFSQFNPTLGTLNAIDLIIQSSTLQGSATITRNTGTRNISNMEAFLTIDPESGFDEYFSDGLLYDRTPSGTFTVNATNTTQLVTVTGTTQSLIGGSPITLGIDPSAFASYTGVGTVSFISSLIASETQTGAGSATVNYSSLLSPTTLALRYTYSTGPSPVPEPGQVAASLLVLGGLGVYFVLRRRRSARVSG